MGDFGAGFGQFPAKTPCFLCKRLWTKCLRGRAWYCRFGAREGCVARLTEFQQSVMCAPHDLVGI
ncbi:hypothetical protein D8771_09315 [Streptomyces albus]|uniref:Uncharacterized protein n=1 Tax=Streptomyces albus TaxID=1888 RepID=A0A8H1LKJ4_9ACTN|nr:hypothetical protein ADL27_31405 [Streptomyces sp. NRRL F-6602]TGG86520.1 hypothetical protein D8771_09315 [Streptomyces albus]